MRREDMWPAEVELADAFARGRPVVVSDVDPTKDPEDPAGSGHRVRAEVIARLMRGLIPAEPGYTPAIRLTGATIVGELDLQDVRAEIPLALIRCRIDEPIAMGNARLGSVTLEYCRFTELQGRGLVVDGSLDLNYSHATHIYLGDAQIKGTLSLLGAQLSNPGNVCLNGSSMVVEADLLCAAGFVDDGVVPFRARGGVHLSGATVKCSFYLDGAELVGTVDDGSGVVALSAPNLTVGQMITGTVAMGIAQRSVARFSVRGVVDLTDATVGGSVNLSGALLGNPNGDVLLASGLRVEGTVNLGTYIATVPSDRLDDELFGQLAGGVPADLMPIRTRQSAAGLPEYTLPVVFEARGALLLTNAYVGRNLVLDGGQFAGNEYEVAILAERITVGGMLSAVPAGELPDPVPMRVSGLVSLANAQIAAINILGAQLDGLTTEGGLKLALDATEITVSQTLGGGTYGTHRTRLLGELRLIGSRIGGSLVLSGTLLDNHGGTALNGPRSTIGGDLICTADATQDGVIQPFHAAGVVNLDGVTVSGQFTLNGAIFEHPFEGGEPALNAPNITVVQGMTCAGQAVISGRPALVRHATRPWGPPEYPPEPEAGESGAQAPERPAQALADEVPAGDPVPRAGAVEAGLAETWRVAEHVALTQPPPYAPVAAAPQPGPPEPEPGHATVAAIPQASDSQPSGDLMTDLAEHRTMLCLGWINLVRAGVQGDLILDGASIASEAPFALDAETIEVGGRLSLSCTVVWPSDPTEDGRLMQFITDGGISLAQAKVGRSAELRGARINAAERAEVGLDIRGADIGGDLIIGIKDSSGYRQAIPAIVTDVDGLTVLADTTVSGDLVLSGAQLGLAGLGADGLTVRGDLNADAVISYGDVPVRTFCGPVSLAGADIGGSANLHGMLVNSLNRPALDAAGIRIGRDLKLATITLVRETEEGRKSVEYEFEATGQVSLGGAQIGGSFYLTNAILGPGAERGDPSLIAYRLDARFLYLDVSTDHGHLDLSGARVGELHYRPRGRRREARMKLDGLRYDRLIPTQEPRKRLRWLIDPVEGFAAGPYEQLAAEYRRLGQNGWARRVMISKHRRLWLKRWSWRRPLQWPSQVALALWDALIGYGYAPGRAFVWLAAAFLAGYGYFTEHPPVPVDGGHAEYRPVLYVLDALVPTAPFDQAKSFEPAPGGYPVLLGLQILGWLIPLSLLPAVNRLFSRD